MACFASGWLVRAEVLATWNRGFLMKLLELPHTLSGKIERLLRPILEARSVDEPISDNAEDGWRTVLEQLGDWQRDPDQLADEGVEAPTSEVLDVASPVAEVLRDTGIEPPQHVVPNGDAGIVFRWRSAQQVLSLELDSDGSVESYLLHRGKLVWRHVLHA